MLRKRHLLYLTLLMSLSLSLTFAVGQIAAQDNSTCPAGQTYWKSTPVWPVTQLMLGSQAYTQVELVILLNTPPDGDASLILAQQLIAAKLNAAKGLDSSVVAGVISQGDALLAAYTGRLPYHVATTDSVGQTMTNLNTILTSYNEGLLTVGCSLPATLTPTPIATVVGTPQATLTPVPTVEVTPESTAQPGAPVIIVIEGPVQAININIITIYNINIQLADNDPNLKIIQVGDVLRIEGTPQTNMTTGTIVIVAITVVVVNVEVDTSTGQVWRDDKSCANPPPSWAPANGWRRRCQPQNNNNQGNDDKHGKKHGDDEGDD